MVSIIKQHIDTTNSTLPKSITESILKNADLCSHIVQVGYHDDDDDEGGIFIRDFRTKEVVRFIKAFEMKELTTSPCGKYIVASPSYKSMVYIWDLTNDSEPTKINIDVGEKGNCTHHTFLGNKLIIGTYNIIQVWENNENVWELVHTFEISVDKKDFITCITSNNKNMFACGTVKGSVHVFDTTFKLVHTFDLLADEAGFLGIKEISFKENKIAVLSLAGMRAIVFDLTTLSHVSLESFKSEQFAIIHNILLSPCNTKVICTCTLPTKKNCLYQLYILDISTGEIINKLDGQMGTHTTFSPEGTKLISCDRYDTGFLRVIDWKY